MLYGSVLSFGRIYTTELFLRLHHPFFDGVPDFHFFEMDVLYAFKAFMNEFTGFLILKTLSPSAMSALPLFHFFTFEIRLQMLNFEVEFEHVECQFSLSFFHSHIHKA